MPVFLEKLIHKIVFLKERINLSASSTNCNRSNKYVSTVDICSIFINFHRFSLQNFPQFITFICNAKLSICSSFPCFNRFFFSLGGLFHRTMFTVRTFYRSFKKIMPLFFARFFSN